MTQHPSALLAAGALAHNAHADTGRTENSNKIPATKLGSSRHAFALGIASAPLRPSRLQKKSRTDPLSTTAEIDDHIHTTYTHVKKNGRSHTRTCTALT